VLNLWSGIASSMTMTLGQDKGIYTFYGNGRIQRLAMTGLIQLQCWLRLRAYHFTFAVTMGAGSSLRSSLPRPT
jgi:hypothetical protein